ncbi:MAG: hypothetical protein RL757_2817 [Bacteroidota bacterium]|jgi:starch synthase
MEILHLSAECYPVAKAGGLGDVVGALPKYQARAGHFAKVVMPFYQTKFTENNEFLTDASFHIHLGTVSRQVHILKEKNNSLGFDLYLVRIEGLLDRPKIYGYDDDDARFLAFQIAVLDWLNGWEHQPDVVHCHDHHSGLVPFFMQHGLKYERLRQIRSVFTIHNGNYQGWISWNSVRLMPAFPASESGLLDWDGVVNPMASAIRCADAITTVSPSYMQELMEDAAGLEPLFRQYWAKCHGILNGIDAETWNPATDELIGHHFQSDTVGEGKWANKQAICNAFGLNSHLPLTVFIGRLVGEKAADILVDAISAAVYATQGRMSFLVLGSGDDRVENGLEQLKSRFPHHFNCYIGYNEALSHQLYAAADFLLMPSRVEPCGLNQMYALRYGTMPLVRNTGGLRDTVTDVGDNGWGIRFLHASTADIAHACSRARHLFAQPDAMQHYRKRMMKIDNSWENSVQKYQNVYQEVFK